MIKTTKNGRTIINRTTKLPVHTRSVEHSIKMLKEMLTISMTKNDAKWASIKADISLKTLNNI